jgi:hypothetical protein
MNTGVWVWPSDPKRQRRTVNKVAGSGHLLAAIVAIAKSKDGLSNSELDDAIGDSSNWMTLWVIRQLTSLGFIEMKVSFFGEAAKYQLTDLGKTALAAMRAPPTPPARA